MNTRQHDNRSLSPTTAGWWVRLLVAGVFAFYLNYVPIHLATAAHLDGVLESLAELVFHGDDHHAEHHDSDEHVPHPATDHHTDHQDGEDHGQDQPGKPWRSLADA